MGGKGGEGGSGIGGPGGFRRREGEGFLDTNC